MKKLTVFLLLIGLMLGLSGCSKDPISPVRFSEVMTERGFQVTEINRAQQVLTATNENYVVQFYLLEDIQAAKAAYEGEKNDRSSSGGFSTTTEFSGLNNGRYTYKSGDLFFMVAYVENTLLLCESSARFEDQIRSDFEALGYQ